MEKRDKHWFLHRAYGGNILVEIVDGQKKVFDKNRETCLHFHFAQLCGSLCALPCERASKITVF